MTDLLDALADLLNAPRADLDTERRCYTHHTTGYCDHCEAVLTFAADTYDPETGRCQRPRKARP